MPAWIQTYELKEELATLELFGEDLDEEDRERLAELSELRDELGAAFGDETLIPESEFEDYARQTAEDIGAIDPNAEWPLYCIDWERAANDLAADYTSVTFDGTDYYVRAY